MSAAYQFRPLPRFFLVEPLPPIPGLVCPFEPPAHPGIGHAGGAGGLLTCLEAGDYPALVDGHAGLAVADVVHVVVLMPHKFPASSLQDFAGAFFAVDFGIGLAFVGTVVATVEAHTSVLATDERTIGSNWSSISLMKN